jgi:hypothetical protein
MFFLLKYDWLMRRVQFRMFWNFVLISRMTSDGFLADALLVVAEEIEFCKALRHFVNT